MDDKFVYYETDRFYAYEFYDEDEYYIPKRREPIYEYYENENESETAIIRAARYGELDTCKSLLEQGANVDLPTKYGCSPLLCAAQRGHSDIVNLLLDWGANIDLLNSDGDPPLHQAAIDGKSETLTILLDYLHNV